MAGKSLVVCLPGDIKPYFQWAPTVNGGARKVTIDGGIRGPSMRQAPVVAGRSAGGETRGGGEERLMFCFLGAIG